MFEDLPFLFGVFFILGSGWGGGSLYYCY